MPYDAVYEINDDSETSLDTDSSKTTSKSEQQYDGSENDVVFTDNSASKVIHLPKRIFDSRDYTNLNVSPAVADLFQFVEKYQPNDIAIQHQLRCFIPNYVPAVNPIDNFVKPIPPDGRDNILGKVVLDEPNAVQSDPVEIQLRLRTGNKLQGDFLILKRVENAVKNSQEIDNWIKTVSGLYRSKPPTTFRPQITSQSVESLMQPWSDTMEKCFFSLIECGLFESHIDLTLGEYAKVVCALLDIPVKDNNLIDSLSVVMKLYDEFQNNQHFNQ